MSELFSVFSAAAPPRAEKAVVKTGSRLLKFKNVNICCLLTAFFIEFHGIGIQIHIFALSDVKKLWQSKKMFSRK
jgi:hypothetical protein